MKNLSPQDLKKWMQEKKNFQLIDIREDEERIEDGQIETSEIIKMEHVMDNIDKLKKEIPIVIFCRTGGRSSFICEQLQSQELDLYNLDGGIMSWNHLHG
jgi:rhodanese-related sulfurtransferase